MRETLILLITLFSRLCTLVMSNIIIEVKPYNTQDVFQ